MDSDITPIEKSSALSGTQFVDTEHPVSLALAAIGMVRDVARPIRALKARQLPDAKSAVYWVGITDNHIKSVVAKRSLVINFEVERSIYEQVLPRLLVSQPQYFGSYLERGGTYGWIILEHLSDHHLSWQNPVHQCAVASWLATVHAAAVASNPNLSVLPDRGPNHYLAHLEAAMAKLSTVLTSCTPQETTILRPLLVQLEWLHGRWQIIVAPSAVMSNTLVHGDFAPKNIHVRETPTATTIYPVDWETAGIGPPMADLSTVDLELYLKASQIRGTVITLPELQCLAQVGRIVRLVASIDWACSSRLWGPFPKAMAQLELYHGQLATALRSR